LHSHYHSRRPNNSDSGPDSDTDRRGGGNIDRAEHHHPGRNHGHLGCTPYRHDDLDRISLEHRGGSRRWNHHCSHQWSRLRREWNGCGRGGGSSKCRVRVRCREWRVNLKKSGRVTVADISLSGFTETIYSTLTKTCTVTVPAITVTMCGSDCYCSFFSSPSMHVANQRSQPRHRLILSRPRHRRAQRASFAPQP